jgi:membrane protease YdiL (CAAX protease family)
VLLDLVLGVWRIEVAPIPILFAGLSTATLVEEIYFRGFLLNEFRQAIGFW